MNVRRGRGGNRTKERDESFVNDRDRFGVRERLEEVGEGERGEGEGFGKVVEEAPKHKGIGEGFLNFL